MIRHGKTKGNKEHRYVGNTDEGLLAEAVERLREKKMPKVKSVYVSPLKRCRETADILYPDIPQTIIEQFKECDFGRFEYCNYEELNGNPDYQQFIDTLGKSGFPDGESRDTFQKRCVEGFNDVIRKNAGKRQEIAIVVHGGTIMAILDWYSKPHKDYYEWQVENEKGFESELIWSETEDRFYLSNIREL